jgi:CRISPR system Cascade subunit CasA
MNLTTDPWIPVIDQRQIEKHLSLQSLFEQADHLRDLSVTPVQRIALMRLLICITQAALNGPEDETNWLVCRPLIPSAVKSYLSHWKEAFELSGPRAFMQIPDLECKPGGFKQTGSLDCCSPFGGSATVHFARDLASPSVAQDARLNAIPLLCLLNFSTCGKVGQGVWDNVTYNGATFQGPAIKCTHTFVKGKNLLETLSYNLLTKSGGGGHSVESLPNGKWGKPVWELFPKSAQDMPAIENACRTYLGRLVPLSRLVRLPAEGEQGCIIGPPPPSFKIEHLPAFRESSTTVVTNKNGECYYLSVSSEKHIWRELGAVLCLSDAAGNQQAALPLSMLKKHIDQFGGDHVEIWVGGLETGATAAKLSDMLEWHLTIPVNQFGEIPLKKYEIGVTLSNVAEAVLKKALKAYWSALKRDSRDIGFSSASTHFWSVLDRRFTVLLESSADAGVFLNDTWYPIVRSAMYDAYAAACPHSTPRQIQAFAIGRGVLRLKKIDE